MNFSRNVLLVALTGTLGVDTSIAAEVEVNPAKDAFSWRVAPANNYGVCNTSELNQNPGSQVDYFAYFEADLPGNAGIQTVNLVLRGLDGSNNGEGTIVPTVEVMRIPVDWDEGTGCPNEAGDNEISYDNRPPRIRKKEGEPNPLPNQVASDTYPQDVAIPVKDLIPDDHLGCLQLRIAFRVRVKSVPAGQSLVITDGDNQNGDMLPRLVVIYDEAAARGPGTCPLMGACCMAQGGCLETSQADCENIAGAFPYYGDGTTCDSIVCPDPVPAASEWGLISLSIAVVIAGTLLLRLKSARVPDTKA